MKKNIIVGVIAAVFMIVAASAAPVSALSVDEIQAQIKALLTKLAELQVQLKAAATAQTPSVDQSVTPTTTPNRHRICSILARNLSQGAQGDDVRGLQEFLGTEGYLSASATGFFGPMTARALANWQASQGVQSVGMVGPMTRERIKIWCGNPIPAPICTKEYVPVCGLKPIVCITTPCNPVPQTYSDRCMMEADGATFAYEGACRTGPANKVPVISSFSGPTTLAVNASGTWTIQASDPDGESLSYRVTWGDEQRLMPLSANAVAREDFVQTTSFTHAYTTAGIYTMTLVVADVLGAQTKTTSTVRVGEVQPVACTMDAMQCPNGSWVGRTGPNCQFICSN